MWFNTNILHQILSRNGLYRLKFLRLIFLLWRDVLNYFNLIDSGLAYKVGNGHKVRIRVDPWPRSGDKHWMAQPIINFLRENGHTKLPHFDNPTQFTIWRQGCKMT